MALIDVFRAALLPLRGEWSFHYGKNKGPMHENEISPPCGTNTKPFDKLIWTIHLSGGPKRVNHAAVSVGQALYSFGGYCTDEDYAVQRPIDVHVLNPVTYRWKLLSLEPDPCIPFQRYGHTVVSYGTYVYLWGGRNDENACKTLYRFDTKNDSWSQPSVKGTIPGARDGHSAVIIRHKMFIFGGYEEEIGLFSQDVYSLDLHTMVWTLLPTYGLAPSFRDFHTATVYLDRYMFVFGGRGDRHGPFHTRNEMYCNTLVCLDVERQEWIRPKTHGQIPSGRRSHSAFMHNSFMYVFGGYNGVTNVHMNDFYRYDPESGEWKSLKPCGQSPGPRRRQGCVVIDNRVFFFGGTSPPPNGNQIRVPPPADQENNEVNNEESNLVDHDDMFVLDMEPSLKTLCMLSVLKYRLETSHVPRILQQELGWMRLPNRLTVSPLSSG